MIAAEEWRQYEERYIKYGLELKPDKIKKENINKKGSTKLKVTASDRGIMLMLVMAMALCCLCVIFIHAYTANVKYNINTLNKEIERYSNDIDNLNVELRSGNSLDSVEYYAINNLGMVYPGISQTVDVTECIGSEKVNAYIAQLSNSQRGFVTEKKLTVADGARLLLAQS